MTNSTNQGWIKIHRKLLDNPISKKPMAVWFFIYCLLKANHQDNKIIWNKKEIVVKRGSFVSGLKVMSAESGITIQSIRTALVTLKSTNTLTIKTTTKFSIVTILNYSQYQELTPKLTNEQQTTNKQLTTNNNDKNVKNDKNNMLVEKITKWAYERARVIPSCSRDSFIRSVSNNMERVGADKIYKLFEKSENAIQFLMEIKQL